MKHQSISAVIWVALAATLFSCGNVTDEGFSRAYTIEDLTQRIGGPKALAQPGDLILENDKIRVAILAGGTQDNEERHSMGPGLFGGSIIDADRQWIDPEFRSGGGRDQWAELMPTANLNVMQTGPGTVEIINDGSNGEPAIIRASGSSAPFLTLLDALWALVGAPDFSFSTDYILRPGAEYVELKSKVFIGSGAQDHSIAANEMTYWTEAPPIIPYGIESGMIGGDFYLSGGSVDVFAPGIGFDEDGAVYEATSTGQNTFQEPFTFPFIAGVSDGVSYGIAAKEGNLFVPLFTASQTIAIGAAEDGDGSSQRFAEGTVLEWSRYFFIGTGDVGSIMNGYIDARGLDAGTVQGFVTEDSTGEGVSGVSVFVYLPGEESPYSQWETDGHPEDRSEDGSFGGLLPVGDYELMVHQRGRPATDRVPITVEKDAVLDLNLVANQPGSLRFRVRDETGRTLPAKVTVFPVDGVKSNRDPVLGDGFVGGNPETVAFALYGEGETTLRPGTYYAVASRGLEYEIDSSEPFTIVPGTTQDVELTVRRSINTDGWISADFHVHARPSHDSGVLLPERVRTMVCEGVEFFASTDHDFITDYAPHVEALGMEEWVQTAIGAEVTTIEVGHFLGFPLGQDHLVDAGGAMDWTGKTPSEIMDTMRMIGGTAGAEPVIFVGHPRDGILGYFDQFGFDPYGGTPGLVGQPGQPEIETPILSFVNPLLAKNYMDWNFDGVEVLNGKRLELVRTPTQVELDDYAAGGETDVYDMLTRTMQEQEDLENGVYRLGYGYEGHVDDWFTLLNLGFKHTVLGNSDTHGYTGTESGCPRNYVMSDTDDPAFIDDQAIANAVKEHRVVASYGPFLRMWVDDESIGTEFTPADSTVKVTIDVQAPTWIDIDRVELYQNGSLIHEWEVESSDDVDKFYEEIEVTVDKDSWFVAATAGRGDLAPVFTPVEIPYVELTEVVTEALDIVPAVSSLISEPIPIPRTYPVHPYAITNPVWVDLAGDGFNAPGLPEWLEPPVEPADPADP